MGPYMVNDKVTQCWYYINWYGSVV